MRTLFLLASIILAPTILTSCEDGSGGKIFGDDSEYQVFSYYMDIDDDRMWGSTITYLCLSAYEASYIANSISDYCVSPSTDLTRVYRADRNYHPWRISDRPGIDCYDTIYDIPDSDLSPADVYPCNEDETKDCGYTRNEECFNNDALDTWYAENSDCYSYLSK